MDSETTKTHIDSESDILDLNYKSKYIEQNKIIKDIELYKKRSPMTYRTTLPFLALYGAVLAWFVSDPQQYVRLSGIPVLFFMHVLSFIAGYWNSKIKCYNMFSKVDTLPEASHFRIIPHEHQGKPEIVLIDKPQNIKGKSAILTKALLKSGRDDDEMKFMYQRRKYTLNKGTQKFDKPSFKVTEKVSFYKKEQGVMDKKQFNELKQRYGLNQFDIPEPTFWELYQEHMMAPFFVFQIFCTLLWMLDEYWYYSLFTIVMLFGFEATTVNSRLRNLKQVRQMSVKIYQLNVFREGEWINATSDQLLPGDIIELLQQKEGYVAPCDILLLNGKCVTNEALLTGESTPQIKNSIEDRDTDKTPLNIEKSDKNHVIFGGTRIMTHHHTKSSKLHLSPPKNGAVGYVLRTGFETSHGQLVRTILYNTDHVSANNLEALWFILFLLVWALMASAYVLYYGLSDPNRSRYQLLLNCIMIITSVVPPELPIELSLAVNTSLQRLLGHQIFCTQPFRIPFGGSIHVCCFDKTGTLTSDTMELQRVTDPAIHFELMPANATIEQRMILGGCHSLIEMEKQIIGDPMEKAGFLGTFNRIQNEEEMHYVNKSKYYRLFINKRFAFNSDVKRMSVIAKDARTSKHFVLAKGAPEILKEHFSTLPNDYDKTVLNLSSQGLRVIALGWKSFNIEDYDDIKSYDPADMKGLSREAVESNLEFAGFATFDSGVKPHTAETMKMLVESDHHVMMITGDNPNTAIHVAQQLYFVNKPILTMKRRDVNGNMETYWVDDHQKEVNVPEPSEKFDYCVTGDMLELQTLEWGKTWIPVIAVFARTTPSQKEYIVTTLKSMNFATLMCGDGTNDVGALKQADVGVALLEKRVVKKDKNEVQEKKSMPPKKPLSEMGFMERIREVQRQQQEKQGLGAALEMEDQTVVQLGDASIAAPFTSKQGTIQSVYHIIRQGRCTLATTMQMYKILALNCLISAYSLSVLYLDGVKYGDTQMVIQGLVMTFAFLFNSRSQAMPKLSKLRPMNRIFNTYFITSLMGQFFIHVLILVLTISAAKVAQPPSDFDRSIDTTFKPNLLNSVVFIVTSLQSVVTFFVNYQGHPFMQSIIENKGLGICLAVLTFICLSCASNMSEELNESMELVMMPDGLFRNYLVFMCFLDIFACWGFEKLAYALLR